MSSDGCSCSVERHSCTVCLIAVEEVIHFCDEARVRGSLCSTCKITYHNDALCEKCGGEADAEYYAGYKPSFKERIRHAAHNAKAKIRIVPPQAGPENGLSYDSASPGPSPVMGTTVAEASALLSPPVTPTAKRQSWIKSALLSPSASPAGRRRSWVKSTLLSPNVAHFGKRHSWIPSKIHRRSVSDETGVVSNGLVRSTSYSTLRQVRSADPRRSCDGGFARRGMASENRSAPQASTSDAGTAEAADDGFLRPLPDFELPPRRTYSDSSLFQTSDDSASVYSQ